MAFDIGLNVLQALTEAVHAEKPGSLVVGEIPNQPKEWFPSVDGAMHFAIRRLLLGMADGTLDGATVGRMLTRIISDAGVDPMLKSWLWRRHLHIRLQRGDWWQLRRGLLGSVARIGLPAAAGNMGWRLAFMASVAVVGGLGTTRPGHACLHAADGDGGAAVRAGHGAVGGGAGGHPIGAGHFRQARDLVRRSLLRGRLVSVAVASVIALAGPWLLQVFTKDAALIAAATMLLWWTVRLEPGRTFNLVVINALRAVQDARYPVCIGAWSMLIVMAGGSWLLGSDAGLGWGLPGVWIAYIADEWLRGLLKGRRWAPQARQIHRRLRAT